MNMSSPARSDRKTVVVRIPRKYRYLIAAYSLYLKQHPDQATLWECEEYLSQQIEETSSKYRASSPDYQLGIAAAYCEAKRHLEKKTKRAAS